MTHVNELQDSALLDVQIDWIPSEKSRLKKQQVLFHTGTSELVADLKMFDSSFGRLNLSEPTLVLPGDRFILRRPSPSLTIAGGTIIDAFPCLGLNRTKTLARMRALAAAAPAVRIAIFVEESANGILLSELIRNTGLDSASVQRLILENPNLFFHAASGRVFSKRWLGTKRAQLVDWLREFHRKNPSVAGAPITAARLGLAPEIASVVMDGFRDVRVKGDFVSLAIHQVVFNDVESRALVKIERAFREAGYQPPHVDEVIRSAIPDPKKGRALLETLLKSRKLVRIAEGLIFHADVIQHVRTSLAAHKGRRFSVPEFKEWTQMSRKYAIPILEYLDREKITRRDGDYRVIV